MPFCPQDKCETCGCCMEMVCITHGCHELEPVIETPAERSSAESEDSND